MLTTPRSRGSAVVVLLTAALGLPPVAGATAAPSPSSPCAGAPGTTIRSTLGLPGGRTTIDLAATPRFTVTGALTGDAGQRVTSVDVLADGVRVATVTPGQSVLGVRSWSWTTSAPPGVHTLTTCAHTAAGDVPGTPRTVTVTAPPADAVVTSPALHELTGAERTSLSQVTASSLAFAGYSALPVGAVVTAPPSAAAPDGLFRRVTGRSFAGDSTVLSTLPATIDDALWQGTVDGSLPVEPLRWSGPVRLPGAGVSLEGSLDYEARLRLEVGFGVTAVWGWGPKPATTRRLTTLYVTGRVAAPYSLQLRGSGTLDAVTTASGAERIRLAPVRLSDAVPVWLGLRGSVRVGARGAVGGDLSLTGDVRHYSAAGRWGPRTADAGSIVKASVSVPATGGTSLDLELAADLAVSTDGSPGPVASLSMPLQLGGAQDVCAGGLLLRVANDRAITPTSGWGRSPEVPYAYHHIRAAVVFPQPCAHGPLTVGTLQLPITEVGEALSAPLLAHGGTPPYTWQATELPAGLHVSSDGRVTGTPGRAGTSTVRLAVRDATGTTVAADVDLIVAAPGTLTVTSPRSVDIASRDLVLDQRNEWEVWDEGCLAEDPATGLCLSGSWSSIGAPWIGPNPHPMWSSSGSTEETLDVSAAQAGDYVLTALVRGYLDVRLDDTLLGHLGSTGLSTHDGLYPSCDGDDVDNALVPTQVHLRLGAGRHRLSLYQLRWYGNSGLSWTLVPAAIAPPPPPVQGTADLFSTLGCYR
ncbi:MAG: putative Ig domain-containing protein [Kineosporiaceae bacterium]